MCLTNTKNMAQFTDSPILTQRFTNALILASQLHANQVRKGHIQCPYISHLMSVSALVLEMGGNEDEAIGGLLHDSVEDTDYTLAEIETQFGKNVSSIVNCITENKTIENKKERKLAYLQTIKESNNPSAYLVFLADKLHNGRCYLSSVKNFPMITEELIDFYQKVTDLAWEFEQKKLIKGIFNSINNYHELTFEVFYKMKEIVADRK